MTIPEASQLVVQAGGLAKGGEIFVLDMGEPVKIVTLAENLIKLSGFEPYKDIDIQFSGLRPGEKLYEELSLEEELDERKKTGNDKIFVTWIVFRLIDHALIPPVRQIRCWRGVGYVVKIAKAIAALRLVRAVDIDPIAKHTGLAVGNTLVEGKIRIKNLFHTIS